MKYLFTISVIFFTGLSLTGCYYDDPAVLNPNGTTCDTTAVTYSGSVNPLLTANCTGCHSGANAPLNVQLDNYPSVQTVAKNGRLMGAITHAAGFSPMPKNGTKLSDCSISKIRIWVAAGAPNN